MSSSHHKTKRKQARKQGSKEASKQGSTQGSQEENTANKVFIISRFNEKFKSKKR